jgi:hypothetical protein
VVSFYSGCRVPQSEVDAREWEANANALSVDADEDLGEGGEGEGEEEGEGEDGDGEVCVDVPAAWATTDRYCAALGHKANHSFSNNAQYEPFVHPVHGHIKCLRALRDIREVRRESLLTVGCVFVRRIAGRLRRRCCRRHHHLPFSFFFYFPLLLHVHN